jgi:hypothetical protein
LNNTVDNLQWVSEKDLAELRLEKKKSILLKGEIKDHNGYYYINNEGNIYSFYINNYLKFTVSDSGYYVVSLRAGNDSGDINYHQVHRLVADNFIPKINCKLLVNHKDGNYLNCHVSNLEWTDYRGNAKHAHDTGLQPKKKNMTDYKYYQLDDKKNIIKEFTSISDINDHVNAKYDKVLREIMDTNDENTKVLGYYWRREKINHDIHDDEIWKPTKTGYDFDKYTEVSNYGRVKNKNTDHYYVVSSGKHSKYYKVNFSLKFKKSEAKNNVSFSIHRLVAMSFLINNFGNSAHVDHIDKDPSNNHLSNLQWIPPKYHMKKDHGIPIVEVKDNGDVNYYDMMTEGAEEIGCNVGMISEAITKGKKYRDSYWYRLSEYDEEKHKNKINDLLDKQLSKVVKKKVRNYAKENVKRKEKIKVIKEEMKKKKKDSEGYDLSSDDSEDDSSNEDSD